jgi:hypothetical protein
MKVINKSARLITINFDHKSYDLMPAGDAVEIPSEAKSKCKFLGHLIEDGSVDVLAEEKPKRRTKTKEATETADAETTDSE